MEREIWKDIPGYEAVYQVSNMGRVRSLDRTRIVKSPYGGIMLRTDQGREVARTDNGNGYLIVGLRINGKRRNYYVHRLVAYAFCEVVPGKNVVNHKDHNKRNNRFDNLEFVSQKENIEYSADRMCRPHKSKATNTGEKYIYRQKNVGADSFRVHVRKKSQTVAEKIFPTLEEAVAYRDEVMREWRESAFCAEQTGV